MNSIRIDEGKLLGTSCWKQEVHRVGEVRTKGHPMSRLAVDPQDREVGAALDTVQSAAIPEVGEIVVLPIHANDLPINLARRHILPSVRPVTQLSNRQPRLGADLVDQLALNWTVLIVVQLAELHRIKCDNLIWEPEQRGISALTIDTTDGGKQSRKPLATTIRQSGPEWARQAGLP